MNIFKNKMLIIVLAVVIIAGGGFFVFIKNQSSSKPVTTTPFIQQEVIPTIAPEDIGLLLMARSDKKAIKFEITNIEDISSVDYEISYLAKGNIPRGAIGTVMVEPEDEKISTNYIELGTCSSGKCKYDEGVTSIKLILKITKKDGKVFQTEKTLEL